MASKAFVRTTRPSFYALVHKYNVLVKLLHWPAVPRMRNSIAQGRFGAIIQLQPLPWDDSSHHANVFFVRCCFLAAFSLFFVFFVFVLLFLFLFCRCQYSRCRRSGYGVNRGAATRARSRPRRSTCATTLRYPTCI